MIFAAYTNDSKLTIDDHCLVAQGLCQQNKHHAKEIS